MHKRWVLWLVGGLWVTQSLLVDAAQLEGVQIQPQGGKVQIILDTDGEQPYQIVKNKNRTYQVILPNAKLPAAFQTTGLPAINSRETGVTAEVLKNPNGLSIQLRNTRGADFPYSIQVRSPAAPPVAASPVKPLSQPLQAPDKQEIQNLFSATQQALSQTPRPAPRSALKSPPSPRPVTAERLLAPAVPVSLEAQPVVPSSRPTRSRPQAALSRVVVQKHRPIRTAAVRPPVPTSRISSPKPVSKPPKVHPTRVASPLPQPVPPQIPSSETTVATQPTPPPREINLLAVSEPERPPAETAKKPASAASTLFGAKSFDQARTSPRRAGGLLASPILRWLFVAMVLLGGSLMVALLLAGLWKRRRTPSAMPTDLRADLQEAPAMSEYFDPTPDPLPEKTLPIETVPPDSFKAYLPVDIPEESLSNASPPRQPVVRKATAPSLLVQPVATIPEAVRLGLARIPDKSYMTSPFPLASRIPSTAGGPKIKPLSTNQANVSF